ncbi:MAG: LemA family protein [Planctomycetes bacterium]|nr:LemA family protein [Planctomycetota bacterium]
MHQRQTAGKISKGLIALIVVVVVVGIGLAIVWMGYDKAIRLDEAVSKQWAQVDTVLARRFDLIPNLVETVKGYAAHEQELFTHIADARTRYFQAGSVGEKAEAASQVQGALSRLLLLREQYPELKANENFLALQVQLEGAENRIAVERKRYNDAVREVNTYARSFFGRAFCSMAGVGQARYFEASEQQKQVPTVSFEQTREP